MKGSNCVEILARVILKKNILGFTKFSGYIKKQLHHWNVLMIYQNVSEHTSHPPELLFKKVFCIYAANLWENTHVKVRLCWATLLKPHFHIVVLCKSVVCLQNTFFEEHLWENTYCSGHSISALWKPSWSQDDITFIEQGTKISNHIISAYVNIGFT